MPICPNCGSKQADGVAFCDECGAALEGVAPAPPYPSAGGAAPVHPPTVRAMGEAPTCPNCGAQLEPDSAFCDMCGATVGAPAARPPTEPELPGYPPVQPEYAVPSQPGYAPPQEPYPDYGHPQPAYSQAPVTQARLVVQATNVTLPLPQGKQEIVLGRDDPVSNLFPDIDLTDYDGDDLGVSRQHARIYFQGGQAFIEDRNSTNHTYVNGKRLKPWEPHPINHGDEVRLGRLKLNFYTV